MSLFVMTVMDTFHLGDGRTVFVDSVETKAKLIPACDCEILDDDTVKLSLRIDGEEIVKGSKTPNRSVSTSQQLNLASYGIARSGFTIRSKA